VDSHAACSPSIAVTAARSKDEANDGYQKNMLAAADTQPSIT
jgi:hypothetical protein